MNMLLQNTAESFIPDGREEMKFFDEMEQYTEKLKHTTDTKEDKEQTTKEDNI